MENQKQWFESWFDTHYYHLLYKNRDDSEAKLFLDRILDQIELKPPASILDLACGKGRHAHYLAKKGFQVTGYDLSPSNIKTAKMTKLPNLFYEIKDMRLSLGFEKFDAIFSLFTGFGYFDNDEENFLVFNQIQQALKPGGLFLFDYLNENYVRNLPIETCHFEIDGILFSTRKEFRERWVIKHIEIQDGKDLHHFSERVAMYSFQEIADQLLSIGIIQNKVFGNYELSPFFEDSPRLIFIGKKV